MPDLIHSHRPSLHNIAPQPGGCHASVLISLGLPGNMDATPHWCHVAITCPTHSTHTLCYTSTCRVRGGPRAIQMLKHPLKGAGSHPLTQAKSAQHCSATRRLPCKRAHITWPSGQHGRYSALVPCSNHMPHTFNTHSTHTLLPTHSTHTHTILAINQKLARHMWVVSLPPPPPLNGNRCCMLCQEATW